MTDVSPVFRLCDEYIVRWAALDPVAAGALGVSEAFGAATDYGPEGIAARAELMSETLTALRAVPVADDAGRLAALHLRERLEAQLAWHTAGEAWRDLRTPFGRISSLRDSIDLLPRGDDEAWRNIAARLRAIPVMFGSWRDSLAEGLRRGLPAARRQAVEARRRPTATRGRGHTTPWSPATAMARWRASSRRPP